MFLILSLVFVLYVNMKLRSTGVCFALLLLSLVACAEEDKGDVQERKLISVELAIQLIFIAIDCAIAVGSAFRQCIWLRKERKEMAARDESSKKDFYCACRCQSDPHCELSAPYFDRAKDDVKVCFTEKNKLRHMLSKIMKGKKRSKKATTHAIALSDRNQENYCVARNIHVHGPRLASDIEEPSADNFRCPSCHDMHCQCYSEAEMKGDVLAVEEMVEHEEALTKEFMESLENMLEEESEDYSSKG